MIMNDIKQYIDNSELKNLIRCCNQDNIQSITLTQKSNSFETHPPKNRGCGIGGGDSHKLYNKISDSVIDNFKKGTVSKPLDLEKYF